MPTNPTAMTDADALAALLEAASGLPLKWPDDGSGYSSRLPPATRWRTEYAPAVALIVALQVVQGACEERGVEVLKLCGVRDYEVVGPRGWVGIYPTELAATIEAAKKASAK